MPFTFAHPIYSFPIKYIKPKYFSLSGLILGSMSPDFEYFIALEPYQTIGHTNKGLFLQAIPLCVIFSLLINSFIKKSLIQHLPSIFDMDVRAYGLLKDSKLRNITKWIIFIFSVVIGFYSHIFIDSFTHESGYFVNNYSFLQAKYFSYPLFKLLQYSLSMIGIIGESIFVVYVLYKSPINNAAYKRIDSKQKISYWISVLIIAISTVLIKLIFTSSANIIGIIIVSSITGFFLGVIIAGIFFRKE